MLDSTGFLNTFLNTIRYTLIWSWCFIMEELLKYYKEGMKYFAEGNLDKAISYLKIAAAEGIDKPEVNNAIALILIYKGDLKKRIKFF